MLRVKTPLALIVAAAVWMTACSARSTSPDVENGFDIVAPTGEERTTVHDALMLGIDPATGAIVWETAVPASDGASMTEVRVAPDGLRMVTTNFGSAPHRSGVIAVASDGEPRWQFSASGTVMASNLLADGRSLAWEVDRNRPSRFGTLHLFASDGTPAWTKDLVVTNPIFAVGSEVVAILNDRTNSLIGLALTDGSEQWSLDVGPVTGIDQSIAYGAHRFYVAVGVSDRKELLSVGEAGTDRSTDSIGGYVESIVDVSGSVGLFDGDGRTRAVDLESGEVIWTIRAEPDNLVYTTDRAVALTESGLHIDTITTASGEPVGSIRFDGPIVDYTTDGTSVWVARHDGFGASALSFAPLDAETVAWDVELPGSPFGRPALVEDVIVVAGMVGHDPAETGSGWIAGFDAASGTQRWRVHLDRIPRRVDRASDDLVYVYADRPWVDER